MMFWSLFWWQWLAWLAAFSGVGSVVILIAWKLWNPKTLISNFAFSTWRMFLFNALSIGKKAGFAFLFGLIGWTWRDYQLTNRTMTFRHVKVVSKISDTRYLMQPAGMKVYEWEFCHAITPPARVVDIKFEQHNGCKQIIGVGFLEISPQEKNYAEIGRNSATATATAY